MLASAPLERMANVKLPKDPQFTRLGSDRVNPKRQEARRTAEEERCVLRTSAYCGCAPVAFKTRPHFTVSVLM